MSSAMSNKTIALLLLSSAVLAGCGASSNSAPIVYGTQPNAPSRIYNSPADVYLAPEQRAPRQAPSPSVYDRDVYASAASTDRRYNAQRYSASQYQSAPQYSSSQHAPAQYAGSQNPLPPQQVRATPNSRPASLAPVTQSVYSEPLPPVRQYVSEQQPTASVRAPRARVNLNAGSIIVGAGDTVYAIARRVGTTPQAIIAQNRLAPPYTLEIGQQLRVPSVARTSARPVSQVAPIQNIAASDTYTRRADSRYAGARHIVRPGDTLYSISRATGVSVAALAQANGLRVPYSLSIGDQLQIPNARSTATLPAPRANVQDLTREVSYATPAPAKSSSLFDWPVKGAVIGHYGAGDLGRRNDGINIAAPVGTPVRSAAEGEVVYRGSELDGYGNLLLIKHDGGYVTAYAHNDVMLVRKGQKVRKGQIIAKVGQSGSAPEPQLHFEIRQNLKSIDPLAFLQ